MNQCFARHVAFALFFVSTVSFCHADISLPSVFTDNMVLQRETEAKIYGLAEPKQNLSVQLGERELKTTADADGNWSVMMPTGSAPGPFELTVTAKEGQPQVKLQNVMVGEVWLCSGQSNMRWPVNSSLNATREIERSIDFPNIRLFAVKEHPSRLPLSAFSEDSGWNVCSPDSVGDFSGVGYYFARELNKTFPDVPIGLIMSANGGTACEAWTSRKGLESVDRFSAMLEHWDGREDDNKNRPAVLFNGMIAPLKDVNFRGVLWYQGESNCGRGEQYAELFPNLIRDWRSFFGQPEMPFLFVQLAPFRYTRHAPESLPEVWDAQVKTLSNVKNVGMVVTTDIGNVEDIHPKNKQEVGRRLALQAVDRVYREMLPKEQPKVVASGPIYKSMLISGSLVRLQFDHSDGLRAKSGGDSLTNFQIAGADQKFFDAKAAIVDGQVELSCQNVKKPVAVRFAWNDSAQPNLFNGAGLPASPFRTDDFPLLSNGKDF
jgi:sialate O-acetylesterase